MAKNNRQSSTANHPSARRKNVCIHHPDRIASRRDGDGNLICHVCAMGKIPFKHRFGQDAETFYKPGGPGWAGHE